MSSRCNTAPHLPDPDRSAQIRYSRQLETREKAVVLFARRGFAQVGMRELATHLGIHAGSIYNHIESKEALLFELIETLYEDLLKIVTRPVSTRISAEKRLSDLIMAHLDLHENKGDFFQVAEHDLHCLDAPHRASILALRQRYENHLIDLLTPLGISPDNTVAITTARTFVRLLNNLPSWTANADLDSKTYRALMRNIVLGAVGGAMSTPFRCHVG